MRDDEIPTRHLGRTFSAEELQLIREVSLSCSSLSRTELAKTVCELVGWRRRNGSLRGLECRAYLERLEGCGFIELASRRVCRPVSCSAPRTRRGSPGEPLVGSVEAFAPVELEQVRDARQGALFRELVGRYHPQGYTVAYGAQLRYLLRVSQPRPQVVGCLRFSSPAWRLRVRDRWIGWDEPTRCRNLQQVVNNSRFLILPWVQIRNLASQALSLSARRLRQDWPQRYGVEPLLLETLVDRSRFTGTSYLAANWTELGLTAGRGRMDREHRRHDLAPKKVLIYPLVVDAARRLRVS